ncbi:DEAD/DEAH box helicase family protein [Cobetia marina]|uniref:DEAD/DEAH box helicase family protein n=1 Tax=Cobetia marina TaxID=28258 RepID=A0ABU9GDA1_COBMA
MTPRQINRLLPSLTSPTLRAWQARCIETALQRLSDQRPHFLCQATPGAGKMLMAAVLTEELILNGSIDHVIYLGPTSAVVERARETFSQILGRPMQGRLGDVGIALTYQALSFRLEDLKQLCRQGRVLLVWDESHHAAGATACAAKNAYTSSAATGANQWGMALLALERDVRFTLALSGTPWRTDGSCLPMLRYMAPSHEAASASEPSVPTLPTADSDRLALIPDFTYPLRDAIQDDVCRTPQIYLIDNDDIRLVAEQQAQRETLYYQSIPALLRHPGVHYAALLRHPGPQQHLLDVSSQRLRQLQEKDPTAAGLVVASNISHAEDIADCLKQMGQTVCLVTSQTEGAHARLEAFRYGHTSWIVSVNMVSEGIDIPRLQVCCYLSHVRTEQYFRQVLGRIIRRRHAQDDACYFYALNESTLRHYAYRLFDDLPDEHAAIQLDPFSSTTLPASIVSPATDSIASNDLGTSGELPTIDMHGAPHSKGPMSECVSFSEGVREITLDLANDVAFSNAFLARLVSL